MNVRKKNPAGILLTVILLSALLTICLELGLSYLRPDTPGSIPKHLIHFVIMFTLLGGAVLLCHFCPPFKKLWAWIDKNILSKETRPIAIDIIYAIIAGLMLLHHFYVLLYYPTIPTGATKLAPIWIIWAGFAVLLSKSWQDFGFRIATVFIIFSFERLFFKHLTISSNNTIFFISAVYALCICYSVFSAIRPSIWKIFLQVFCAIWALVILVLSAMGLYTAWTGIEISNLVGSQITIEAGRLFVFSVATITSAYFSCGIIMAILGLAISKRKPVKVFYMFVCLIAMIANSLTDSRSSILILGFMVAGTLCFSLWFIFLNKRIGRTSKKKTILVVISLILCFGLCSFLAIEGQRFLATFFVDARNHEIIFPIAQAEENETVEPTISPPAFRQRDVWLTEDDGIDRPLSGRDVIWQKGFYYIQVYPKTLIWGLSVDGSVTSAIRRSDHSHNILLQTLLEGGIPALLLYLSLVFYGVFHAFRLWNRRNIPFWQRILPLPVFSILLWEMAECLTHFSYGHPPMTLFWFFLGATITVSKTLGKASKANVSLETIPATETGE